MKKNIFLTIKNELKNRRENIKYFNLKFFDIWVDAIKKREKAYQDGTDESYYKNGVKLFKFYDDIYKSDFYNKNSCAYCEFLCVAADFEKKILAL